MRLSSATILIGTFVAAALFALVAATFTARALERTSADGVRMELDIGGLEWTDVTANGLQVEITGVAPSEAERFRAITVAAEVVDASRVIDKMTVAASDAIACRGGRAQEEQPQNDRAPDAYSAARHAMPLAKTL